MVDPTSDFELSTRWLNKERDNKQEKKKKKDLLLLRDWTKNKYLYIYLP